MGMLGVTIKNLSDPRRELVNVFGASDWNEWNEWAISSLSLAFVMDLGIIKDGLGSAGHTSYTSSESRQSQYEA